MANPRTARIRRLLSQVPSQPAPAFESGIHSNEIKTSDEEETPESNPAPLEAAPKSNEIVPPTSVVAPSPVSAPKEAVKPEPYVAPVASNESHASPSFVFKPAQAEKKDETVVLSPLDEEKPAQGEEETPVEAPLEEKKSEPIPETIVPSAPAPNKPANPTPIVPKEEPIAPTPVVAQKPTPAPAPAPAPAPVSPLDQCNQPKAQPFRLIISRRSIFSRPYPANANPAQMKIECQARAATINQASMTLAPALRSSLSPSALRSPALIFKPIKMSRSLA
jgi:hypothetical protein